jgi:hypothetical protein
VLGVVVVAAACLVASPGAQPSSAAPSPSGPAKTVWLCQPGQANDPCALSPTATSVTATGTTTLAKSVPSPTRSKFDCFYVYPTVSSEKSANADLKVQPAEIVTAQLQASRFSQVCRVWAPMYRQRTVASLFTNNQSANEAAYSSLLSGWRDYLAHDNDGRPVIFIGHSQGAAILIKLLHNEIDPSPVLRKRMVSAILLGGNVQVPVGKVVGGSFRHLPLCAAIGQTSCVIAYSSFDSPPPANSLFARPAQGVSLQSNQTARRGQQVACVNPATLSAASGALVPYFLSAMATVKGVKIATPWVSFPGLYAATCESAFGATWLQINAASVAGDPRPKVSDTLGPTWGLHLDDVNLALGNLVQDVAAQERTLR